MDSKGSNTSNGSVGNGEFSPVVARDAGTSGKGKEIVRPLGIAGWVEGNGGLVVVKNLGVATKFNAHRIESGAAVTHDNGIGAKGVGDAVDPRKYVETPDNISDHVANQKFGEPMIGKSVNTGAKTLLNGPNGAFHFTNII